ncbi:hypothetical protein JCM11491_006253 [Sporobolomyces phaffii]
MNLDRILNPRSVPSRNTARHDIGFILGPTTEPKLVQNPAAYFGHKGSPLAQALKEVVALLGNSPLARDWAQSIHGPLETSWESQSFSHNIADKLRGFEKKVTGTVNGVIDTLVQRHELVLRGEPGQAEVERLILVAMPPFEQVYDNIDLDHNAFPDSSWFRDYAARHHFGIRVPEDIRVMHQNDLKVGIELDLAGIQAMRRKHPSFSGNTQHSQNFPHGNQEENDDLFEDACSDYHKMGLVDYGSDSDSDSTPPPAVAAPPKSIATSSSGSSLLNLPPPKSSLNLPKPAAATSSSTSVPTKPNLPPPKKKEKGPVRILLDLPAAQPDATAADGPARKKPKLALGNGAGLSGLAAMLPKPKNDAKVAPPAAAPVPPSRPATLAAGLGDMFGQGEAAPVEEKASMFAPTSVRGKGKGKVSAAPPPSAPAEPAVDFFGIGSVTASSASSLSSSSKPTVSSAPAISSAPSLREPATSTAKQPTADDPYPGFTQLPSGEWVAKDQKSYELAVQWQQQQQAQLAAQGDGLPKGFDEKEIANMGGYKDVDEAQRAKDAWATRPSVVPGREEEYKKSTQIKGIPKQASQQARRKGQLSSLIAEAHDNRAELEERIAQARSNRKSAGNKYGF